MRRHGGISGKIIGGLVVLVVVLMVTGLIIGGMSGGGVDPELIRSCLPLRDASQLKSCIETGAVR